MDGLDEAVVGHYESIREEERITSGLGQLELVRTQEVLRRHLPTPPAHVLDIGGATGVHAAWLAADGYQVHIVDVTPRHVEAANATLGDQGVVAELGDARSLDFPDDSFDAVLMLGPLYHLTERADRLAAISEACRVARPGGLVALAAISRFASLFDGLARGFLFDVDFLAIAKADLKSGQHRNPDGREHWFTTAFFHHPDELRDEAAEAGLEILEQVGLEGLGGYLAQLASRWDDLTSREVICWAARAVESNRPWPDRAPTCSWSAARLDRERVDHDQGRRHRRPSARQRNPSRHRRRPGALGRPARRSCRYRLGCDRGPGGRAGR